MRQRKGTLAAARSRQVWHGAYLSALVAVGLCRVGGAQAVDPVNIGGGRREVPSAVVPQVAPPAAHGSGMVAQAVVPINIGTQPATAPAGAPVIPTPMTPATPAIPPAIAPATPPATPAIPPATVQTPPVTPVAPVTPATPETVQTTPATPTTPVIPTTPTMPMPSTTAGTTPSVVAPPGVATWPTTEAAVVQDGKSYPLTGLKIDYYHKNAEQPPIEDLLATTVELGVVADGYVAPRPGITTVKIQLGEIGKSGPQKIYRSGIESIYGQIVRFFNARGVIGVFVVVDAKDIDASDNDIRPADRTTMQFIIVTSVVKQIRTVAIGEHVEEGQRVDNPRYTGIQERSPLQPSGAAGGPERDLLNKEALDDYVLWLNRQPGRRVDVAVSGAGELGGVTLDYLVSESRPWYVYSQVSNTGTSQTDVWRERFGFVDNQVTGHDDIINLEYLTAGFSSSHAVIGSYELPFFNFDRTRYKVYSSWNEYTASDVGQNKENFTGTQWTVGNELTLNIFQKRELFVDAVGGFRYTGITTNNRTTTTHGSVDYAEPYIGLRLDRSTDIATTTGLLMLTGYWTDASKANIAALGRASPSQDPIVLQGEVAQSFYLEPLLDADNFVAGKSTLAHEIAVSARGQYAFGYRLFPQAEDVAGGLYSVRGYPESIVAGDSVVIASGEYRFHVPRIFPIQPDPTKTPFLWDKSFRYSPQQPYGRPDWDLMLKAFVDVGQVVNTHKLSFENNASLVGAGVGVELQYKQNFNVRVDWGAALTDIQSNGTDEVRAGSNRFHISTTILY